MLIVKETTHNERIEQGFVCIFKIIYVMIIYHYIANKVLWNKNIIHHINVVPKQRKIV